MSKHKREQSWHFHSYRFVEDGFANIEIDGKMWTKSVYYRKRCVWCDKVKGRRREVRMHGDDFFERWRAR